MKITELQSELRALDAAMAERGVERPEAVAYIHQDQVTIILWDRASSEMVGGGIYNLPLAKALAEARKRIDAIPTLQERREQKAREAIAAAIEASEAAGLDAPITNPLREAMERLSGNILTAEGAL